MDTYDRRRSTVDADHAIAHTHLSHRFPAGRRENLGVQRLCVAVRDACDLVAALRAVELLVVCDTVEVEVEDVEPVLLRRRPEPDVATHAAGARQIGRASCREREEVAITVY